MLRASTKAVSLKDGEEQEIVNTGVSNINNIVVTGDSIDGTLPEVPEVPEIPATSAPAASQPVVESPVPSEPATSQPVASETPVAPQPEVYEDPIGADEIPEGAITIDQAYQAADGTELTVVGQVQYKYGKNGSVNTTIIEDIIDGEIYGFQVYDSLKDYKTGDVKFPATAK